MGTDIHAFIEFDASLEKQPFAGGGWINSLSCGELCLARDYDLFDALGDGRNYHFKEAEIQQRAIFSPRGLPANPSEAVILRYSTLLWIKWRRSLIYFLPYRMSLVNRQMSGLNKAALTIVCSAQYGIGKRVTAHKE